MALDRLGWLHAVRYVGGFWFDENQFEIHIRHYGVVFYSHMIDDLGFAPENVEDLVFLEVDHDINLFQQQAIFV